MNWRREFDGVYSVEWMESGGLLNAQKSRGVLHAEKDSPSHALEENRIDHSRSGYGSCGVVTSNG